jgi:beta-lactam-binding protein with PASTA domain
VLSSNRSVKATFALAAAAPKCTVPRLKGKRLVQARRAIVRAGCSVGRVTRTYSRSVQKGHVVSQRPVARARRAAGVKVSLVVSRGKAKHG